MKDILSCLLLLTVATSGLSAAPFRNLGFEEVNPVYTSTFTDNGGDGVGFTMNLMPGWAIANVDGTQMGVVGINARANFGGITLFTSETELPNVNPIEGKYGLWLAYSSLDEHYTLSQEGDVPADAGALSFAIFNSLNTYELRMNGNPIPLREDGTGQLYGDVSAFAGSHVTLELETYQPSGPFPGPSGSHLLDDIQFVAIPEPSTWVLLIGGIALLLGWRVFSSRR
jgi:hypothetical protein